MQDLRVCKGTFCQDDFNMPDIDLSFRNFENLFSVDQHPTRGPLASKDVPSLSMEKETFNNSNNVNVISMKVRIMVFFFYFSTLKYIYSGRRLVFDLYLDIWALEP